MGCVVSGGLVHGSDRHISRTSTGTVVDRSVVSVELIVEHLWTVS